MFFLSVYLFHSHTYIHMTDTEKSHIKTDFLAGGLLNFDIWECGFQSASEKTSKLYKFWLLGIWLWWIFFT